MCFETMYTVKNVPIVNCILHLSYLCDRQLRVHITFTNSTLNRMTKDF